MKSRKMTFIILSALSLVIVLGSAVMETLSAQESSDSATSTYEVLHAFRGAPDGNGPQAGLIRDAAGNLYGTTGSGGAFGKGMAFKVDASGVETVLHSFAGYPADGAFPEAALIQDAEGNLYGTTSSGGRGGCYTIVRVGRGWKIVYIGCGTVFKLDTTDKETVLYSFSGGADGRAPEASLIRDSVGNLYGTTIQGGSSGCGAAGCGVVFKLDAIGRLTVLHRFSGQDGNFPEAGLISDAAGNLYGTTFYGGITGGTCGAVGCGVVFKLGTTGTLTVLHRFSGPDGAFSFASLIRDTLGNLYGTTTAGDYGCGGIGCGNVFKLSTAGKLTLLHTFTGASDGGSPIGLIRDGLGNLYGTTYIGGAAGWGTVFKLDTSGKKTVLHSFSRQDGAGPQAGVILDASGDLYGTTLEGGDLTVCSGGGCGVVFKVTP